MTSLRFTLIEIVPLAIFSVVPAFAQSEQAEPRPTTTRPFAYCIATPATAPVPGRIAGRLGQPMRAPAESVRINPGSIQKEVDSHGENTSFLLMPGTYTENEIKPKDGDRFYGQGAVTWDGGGTKQQAFDSASANYVVVSGIRFVNFYPLHHSAGIFGLNGGQKGFIVEGCEIAYNRGGTPLVLGSETRVLNSSIHDNFDTGIGGYMVSVAIIDHNDVYNNYLKKLDPDTATGESAGMKFVKTDGIYVTHNYIHDNNGVGVWFDSENTDTVIDWNVITRNTYRGIMEETSYGAIISNNTITDNGKQSGGIAGAGILVATASSVEICNNILMSNSQGVIGFQEDRGVGKQGRFVTSHVLVHDNYIAMTNGVTGLTQGAEKDPTNRFFDNRYCLMTGAGFLWGRPTDIKGWKAAEQDRSGTFNCGF